MADLSDEANLIIFDADCIFCSGFARFMAKHDKQAEFRFVSARSDLGQRLYVKHGLDPDALETNIVVLDGQAYTKMASFAASMRSLGTPWSLLAIVNLLPVSLANWIYDRIARNRYAFGKRSCPLPSSELKDRFID
ncbi:thiol-disulfide oxidoreductase DCC family protein [Roseibium sp. MMSF_3412]|uniref:thiol-disulfide oxidoreductase DCC family protein n=1 Tax=Roseibium sp. MMSF_3412 TaxID=3046712 RepID=UPI00273FFD1C|nr:DCC1-like thiol-disulfide oxidoreductase family protein [Roseibium sp. MMSF_3412]